MITSAELATAPLFAAMPEALRSRIAAHAGDIAANVGEWIVHEGDPPYFWVVLAGEVEAVKSDGGQDRQMTTFDPGEYFGEVPLMLSAISFAGVRALAPSRLARIDPIDFHTMVTESPDVSALLGQSLVRRVDFIRDAYSASMMTQCMVVGDRYDFACHDLRDFLSRNQISFEPRRRKRWTASASAGAEIVGARLQLALGTPLAYSKWTWRAASSTVSPGMPTKASAAFLTEGSPLSTPRKYSMEISSNGKIGGATTASRGSSPSGPFQRKRSLSFGRRVKAIGASSRPGPHRD